MEKNNRLIHHSQTKDRYKKTNKTKQTKQRCPRVFEVDRMDMANSGLVAIPFLDSCLKRMEVVVPEKAHPLYLEAA